MFVNFGTQVGSQNASKINPKICSKIKCVLASIFLDFGRFWEASWGRNGSKNRCKNASKNDANSDAFWMRLGWVFRWTRHGGAAPGPPPITSLKKNIPNTQTHMTQMNYTLHARQARWRICSQACTHTFETFICIQM